MLASGGAMDNGHHFGLSWAMKIGDEALAHRTPQRFQWNTWQLNALHDSYKDDRG